MERLKQLRSQKGWSQQKLADKLEVSRSAVAMWENSENKIPAEFVIKLANIFCVSTDYLLEKTDYSDDKNHEICNKISVMLESGQKVNEKINVPADVLQAIQNGLYKFTKQSLCYIADYLHVRVNTLLDNDAYDETEEYLEELRTRPEMKMLFNTTKNATKEEIEKAVAVIEALLGK